MTTAERPPGPTIARDPTPAAARVRDALRSPRVGLLLVCLVALAVRANAVTGTPRGPVAFDERYYDGLAWNVLEGRGYRLDGVETSAPDAYRDGPTAIMAPGYPALLVVLYATFGRDPTSVALVQALLGTLGCALTVAVARAWRIGPTPDAWPAVALGAGLLAAFSRVLVQWTGLLLSETLAVALVLLAVRLLLAPPARSRLANGIAVGLVLGAATHVRAELAIVAAVGCLWIAVAGGPKDGRAGTVTGWRRADALLVALTFAAVLVPWTVRNLRALDGFVFVRSFSGPVLYYANNEGLPSAWAMAEGQTAGLPPETADLPPGDELALDRYLRARAVAFVQAHPRRVMEAAAVKTALFWRPIPAPWAGPFDAPLLARTGVVAFWLMLAGLWVGRRTPRRSLLPVGLLLAEAAFVAAMGAWERERFRAVLMPLELILVSAGAAWLGVAMVRVGGLLRGGARPRAGLPAGAALVLAALVLFSCLAVAVAGRTERVLAFSPLDSDADLAAWQLLQASGETATIDAERPARGPGSLRIVTRPENGWQDLMLVLPPHSYPASAVLRARFSGRASDIVGGQIVPILPGQGPEGSHVGLGKRTFGGSDWRVHDLFFFAPFANDKPLALYASHADYDVPGGVVWLDDVTVTEAGWARYLWEGYALGRW